jgi:hypothetical protein
MDGSLSLTHSLTHSLTLSPSRCAALIELKQKETEDLLRERGELEKNSKEMLLVLEGLKVRLELGLE